MESQSATGALYAELTESAGDLSGLLFANAPRRTLTAAELDAARSDPAALQSKLNRECPGSDALALLVAGCGAAVGIPCASVRDWGPLLHQPMTRCFTLLSAGIPLLRRTHDGGHAVLVVPTHALIPDPEYGPSSVLGRGLLGLFEGLAAEVRRTATRVTIFIRHDSESVEAVRARFADALQRRPLFALPASVPATAIRGYFRPIAAALRTTPAGAPLPAGPMGAIYRAAVEAMGHGVTASNPPAC